MKGLPLSFDPKIFLFSIINFGILLFILKKFFFAPIAKILEERKSKIKDGLDTIKKATEELEKANIEKEKIISGASKESEVIIKKTEEMKKEILKNGKEEVEEIIKSSREGIKKEKEDIRKEMHALLIDLVASATDKALLNISKQDNQGNIIEKAILQSLQESSADVDKK
ncbi:MAG: F0F1 ATP synthase subunit B [bacterium]